MYNGTERGIYPVPSRFLLLLPFRARSLKFRNRRDSDFRADFEWRRGRDAGIATDETFEICRQAPGRSSHFNRKRPLFGTECCSDRPFGHNHSVLQSPDSTIRRHSQKSEEPQQPIYFRCECHVCSNHASPLIIPDETPAVVKP